MQDYSNYYATLGVTPDTDWETLRARYRRLIAQWHPDRFSAGAGTEKIAEERAKRITLAYQALERYHRDHGVLPPMQREVAMGAGSPEPSAASRLEPVASSLRTDSTESGECAERAIRPTSRGWHQRIGVALAVIGTTMYFAFAFVSELEPGEAPRSAAADTPPAPTETETTRRSVAIGVGSTLGDVYEIQGVPSSTQDDTWHYGRSEIRFAQGKVISWAEHPDNPLRIDRREILRREGLFGIGSTKEEVRAAQGPPISETDTVWYYAPSIVYFKNNRVVRWEESPTQPLHVTR